MSNVLALLQGNKLIDIDENGQIEQPVLVLSSRGGNKIGVIKNVSSINITHPLADVAELSFDVNKEVDGEVYGDWDEIKDFRFIQMPYDNTWFEATVSIDEENEIVKHVTCVHANEAELGQLNLYETEINTENDIGRDDYVETVFYNEDNPKASLLHRILKDKAPHYQIYHVDDSLKDIFRVFSFNGESIHDALNRIAEEVNCLFVYGEWDENDGKYHRTISAYDLEDYCQDCHTRGEYTNGVCTNCGSTNITEGYGEDTEIFVSKENLAQSINYDSNTDNVKNCFRLSAGDDVMTSAIKSCNPSMSQYMWHFSDDMLEDMSDELATKITEYEALVESYKKDREIDIPSDFIESSYNYLVDKYGDINEDLVKITTPIKGTVELTEAYYNALNMYGFLKSELMPVSEKVTDTTATEQLALLQDGNFTEVGIANASGTIPYTTANSAIQSYAKVYIDTSRYKVSVFTNGIDNKIWTGTITITAYKDDEDSATDTFTITLFDGTDNAKYADWLTQSVQKTMASREASDVSVVNLFKTDEDISSFKNRLKLYSLDYLNIMSSMATSAITVLSEQGVASQDTLDTDIYTQLYLPYLEKSRAIQSEIVVRETELSGLRQPTDEDGVQNPAFQDKGLIDIIEEKQNEIRDALNLHAYLGDTLWEELSFYRRESEYSNQNYISDGLTDSEVIEQAQNFIEVATKEIIKASTLQHTISAPLSNFLLLEEFNKLQEKFKVGNWIWLQVDGKVYKLRLANWEIDYDNIDDLDIEFTDAVRVGDTISDVESVLSKSRSMATTYDYTARQADKGKDASDVIKVYRDSGIDFSQVKAITSNGNTNIVYDDDGILLKRVDGVDTLPEQARIYNNGIYITKDAWETVSTGLGHFSYVDPETGNTVNTYGIIADTVIGKLILGENLKIYSQSGKMEMGDDGFVITAKENEDNTGLFTIQKEFENGGNPYVEKYIYVDSNGEVKIAGGSVVIGSQPLVEYIDGKIEEIEVISGVTYKLFVSDAIITKTESTLSPSSITLTSKSQSGDNAMENYSGRLRIETTLDNSTWTQVYNSSANEYTYTYIVPNNIIGIRCSLYMKDGFSNLLDQQTVPVVSSNSVTINSTSVVYQEGTSGTTAPTGSWSSTVPSVADGNYLWTKTTVIYSDGTSTEAYSVARQGDDGGSVGITSTSVTYQKSTSGTTAPTGSWSSTVPSLSEGEFLWTKTVVNYSDGNSTVSYSVSRDGVDGTNGADAYTVILTNENHTFAGGVSSAIASSTTSEVIVYKGTTEITPTITSITGQPVGMTTSISADNTSFTVNATTSLVESSGTLTVNISADGKTFTKDFTYSIAFSGEKGGIWYTGTSITGEDTTPKAFPNSGITSAVAGDMYLNTSTYDTYRCTLGGDASTAKWVYVNNIKGQIGETGKGISSIKNQYYLSTSNSTQSGGSWSSTVPPYVEDCYYWTKSHIVWTDNTETDTTAVLDNGLTDANANAIDARKVATNYLAVDNTGIMVADMEDGEQTPSGILTGKNVFIDSDSVEIREGQNTLSSFGSNSIVLGQKSKSRLELTTSSIKGISNQGVINFDITGQNIDGDGTLNDSGVLVNQATDEDRENGILFKATFRPNLNLNNYDSLTGSINFIFNNNERTYNQTYNFSYDVPDSEPWDIVLPHEETISSIAHYKYGVDMLGSYYTFTFVDLGSQSDIIVDDTVSYNISITSTDYHDSSFSFGSRATSLVDDYSIGSNSCVIGEELVATSANQVAIGRYNYDNTERYPNELNRRYAFMVGNGFLGAGRNNAFAVDWNGRVETGDIKATGLLLEENSKSEMDDYIKCVSAGDVDIFKVNKNGIINAAGRINAPNANFVKSSSNNADYIQCGDTDNNVNFQVLHDGSVIIGNDLLVGNSQTVTNNLTVGGNETITGGLTVNGSGGIVSKGGISVTGNAKVSGRLLDTSSNPLFKVVTKTIPYVHIDKNGGQYPSVKVNEEGYTPVAISCITLSGVNGSSYSYCIVNSTSIDGDYLRFYVGNWNQSYGISIKMDIKVLCIATSALETS